MPHTTTIVLYYGTPSHLYPAVFIANASAQQVHWADVIARIYSQCLVKLNLRRRVGVRIHIGLLKERHRPIS